MYRIGVDTGGTFTDCAVINIQSGHLKRYKMPSTPKNYAEGVMNTLQLAARDNEITLNALLKNTELIIHGTTIATNLIISKEGKDVGLITTKGFRDVIEQWYKEERRYDMHYPPPKPPSPRWLRLEVDERIDFSGKVLKEVNEEDVKKAINFFKKYKIKSIALSLIFSPINSVHEKKVTQIFKEQFSEATVHLSSEILPQLREYERTMATILNAYVAPYSTKYLKQLKKKLEQGGYKKDLLIMQSNSGLASVDIISKIPIRLALSGPASGPTAGLFFSKLIGESNLITIDMGGTSFDTCLVKDSIIPTATDGYISRFRLALPTVDIHSLGAGGGSIAWVDTGGVLLVGPRSAGAKPGPACYGKGGIEPTVTDANLLLGYINPENFLGGRMKLNVKFAEIAVGKIANSLNISLEEAALGIIHVVNNNMMDGIRTVSVKRGYDPKKFVLVAAGGAGPLHATKLAELAKISKVIIPRIASAFCAFGMAISHVRHDYVKAYISPIRKASLDKMNELFEEMESKGISTIDSEKLYTMNLEFERSIDMRYIGQIYEVETPIPYKKITEKNIQEIEELFHKKHELLYGHSDKLSDIEIVHLRLKIIGKREPLKLKELKSLQQNPPEIAFKSNRKVYFEEYSKYVETRILNGEFLEPGNLIEGPTIIEEPDTTILISPNWNCEIDQFSNYILTLKKRER